MFVRLYVPMFGLGLWPPEVCLSFSHAQLVSSRSSWNPGLVTPSPAPLPPLKPQTDSSGMQTDSSVSRGLRGSTVLQLSSPASHLLPKYVQYLDKEGLPQEFSRSPCLVSRLCQGQAGQPPLEFNFRTGAASGCLVLKMFANTSLEPP